MTAVVLPTRQVVRYGQSVSLTVVVVCPVERIMNVLKIRQLLSHCSTAQNTSFPLDTLNLNDCQFSTCVPACFSDCNCTTGGESCPETSAPPTASPTPAPETSDVKNCELKRNEGKCSQVAIRDFVFAGADCYCYNFCDGEFLSCCEENGDCGTTECEGEEVFGCPELVDEPQTPNSAPNGNGDPNGDSSGTVISTQTHMLAVVAAAMFLAWDWN